MKLDMRRLPFDFTACALFSDSGQNLTGEGEPHVLGELYDNGFEVLTASGKGTDELRTIIFKASQSAEFFRRPAISEFPYAKLIA